MPHVQVFLHVDEVHQSFLSPPVRTNLLKLYPAVALLQCGSNGSTCIHGILIWGLDWIYDKARCRCKRLGEAYSWSWYVFNLFTILYLADNPCLRLSRKFIDEDSLELVLTQMCFLILINRRHLGPTGQLYIHGCTSAFICKDRGSIIWSIGVGQTLLPLLVVLWMSIRFSWRSATFEIV